MTDFAINLPLESQRTSQQERLDALRENAGKGPRGVRGVTVPPLASDSVKAAAEKFRRLRDEALSAYYAAATAIADAEDARKARVQARTEAALSGAAVKKADLSAPTTDVDSLIEQGEALCAARDQARVEVIKTMEADLEAWEARNREQIEEASAAFEEHLGLARDAFDRLGASAALRVWLEGRTPSNMPSADRANGYARVARKVEQSPGRYADPDSLFDDLRHHFAADGMLHQPVKASPRG